MLTKFESDRPTLRTKKRQAIPWMKSQGEKQGLSVKTEGIWGNAVYTAK